MHITSTINFLFVYKWEKSYRGSNSSPIWRCYVQALRVYRSFMRIQLICRPFITPIHLSASPWCCQYTIAVFLVLSSSSFPMYLSIPVILMNISSQCSREDITIYRGLAHGYTICGRPGKETKRSGASAQCSNHSTLPLLPFMSWTPVCWLRTTKQISHGNKLLQSQQTWAGFEQAS